MLPSAYPPRGIHRAEGERMAATTTATHPTGEDLRRFRLLGRLGLAVIRARRTGHCPPSDSHTDAPGEGGPAKASGLVPATALLTSKRRAAVSGTTAGPREATSRSGELDKSAERKRASPAPSLLSPYGAPTGGLGLAGALPCFPVEEIGGSVGRCRGTGVSRRRRRSCCPSRPGNNRTYAGCCGNSVYIEEASSG